MILKRLFLKNIRSYEEQEIIFPEGSVLLAGNVGSGKTTILLAIEYALFGLQAGQRGTALLRNNSDFAEVVLEFDTDQAKVIVERSLKRESKSVASDYAAITINGEKIECSTTELKSKILELLNYPSDFLKKNNTLYKYTVYTPQEQMKHIILEDPQSRFSILRHIFGIEKYKRIRDNSLLVQMKLKEQIKGFQLEISLIEKDKADLSSVLENISRLQNISLNLDKALDERKEIRKAIEQEIKKMEEKREERNKLERELEKAKILISSKKEQLFSIEKEEQNLKKSAEEIKSFDQDNYNSLIKEILSIKDFLEQYQKKAIEIRANMKSLSSKQYEALQKKERVFSIDMCPTCLQDVSQVHKHNILHNTEQLIVESKKQEIILREQETQISSLINKAEENLKLLEKQKSVLEIQKARQEYYQQISQKIEEVSKNKEALSKDIILLNQHLNILKEGILSFSSFDVLFKRKQESLRNSFLEERNAEIRQAETKKEITLLIKESIKLEDLIKEKEKIKTKLNNLLDLSEWFVNSFSTLIDTIERQVMLKLRQEFSRFFNTWFSMIAGEGFEVQLDENFTPVIIQGGVEMDYSFLSGGERTAVALAYRLALNQTINTALSNIKTREIIILDEPTEGFSEAQLDKMRDIFEQLKAKQLIIVSHEQKIEGFADHIIKVKKQDLTSSIEYTENQKP